MSSTKNEKQLGAKTGLDKSICHESWRFEHEKASESHNIGVGNKNSSIVDEIS